MDIDFIKPVYELKIHLLKKVDLSRYYEFKPISLKPTSHVIRRRNLIICDFLNTPYDSLQNNYECKMIYGCKHILISVIKKCFLTLQNMIKTIDI
jgi:hypothetical protein